MTNRFKHIILIEFIYGVKFQVFLKENCISFEII